MIINSRIILREKTTEDAWDDYAWEADPELSRLDAAPPTTIPYSQYLEDYTHEMHHPYRNTRQFAIDTVEGKHIGNCSYYNIDRLRGQAELGIMIGNRDYWNKGYGVDVVTTLVDHIFSQTNLKRIYLKTLDWNARAQACFKKCGFTTCGQLDRGGFSFIIMEIHRKEWQQRQKDEN
jgi:RimJ/RimL family protein N-acetyltransferase